MRRMPDLDYFEQVNVHPSHRACQSRHSRSPEPWLSFVSLDASTLMSALKQWKIEKLSELYPGNTKLFEHYWNLPERELAIVAGASIDAGLAECLAKYLEGPHKAVEKFLGLDGSDRAPCGTLSARIQ